MPQHRLHTARSAVCITLGLTSDPSFHFAANPMKLHLALFSVVMVAATSNVQAQTMFKCVQDGKTIYQAQQCPEAAKQQALKAQAAPPATISTDVDQVIEFISTYRACADGVTTWREEMAKPYEAWRNRNLAMVSRIENDSQLRSRYQQRVEAKRNGKAGMCRPVALELRGVTQ
jgi:hypothetical protein